MDKSFYTPFIHRYTKGNIMSFANLKRNRSSLDKLTKALEGEGETATQQARDYIKSINDPQKAATATQILEYTYLIRANEKRYMLYQRPEIFDQMKKDFAS